MKMIIKIWFTLTLITITINGQNMWSKGEIDYESYHLMNNLTTDSIKQIIITNDIESPSILYVSAVKYLYYIKSESQFLLENLNTEIDTALSSPEDFSYWYKVYINTYIRGLLGDYSAIDKMKVIANNAPSNPRLYAIANLAEIGIFDNYSFIKDEYNNQPDRIINWLAWYGNDDMYKEEVKSILLDKAISANSSSEVIRMAGLLNYFSNEGTLLLNNYFVNKIGAERYEYFFELGIIDKDGQPERSMFALQNEVNDTFRVKYLPSPFEVLNFGFESKRYLEPNFVNFLNGLNISDPTSLTYQRKDFFLLTFIPAIPDSAVSETDLLDNLINLADTVYSYTWLGDIQFKDELQITLQSAKTNLLAGDSLACAIDVKTFQDSVDSVYKDSLNTDPRFVTMEGWKFLYWNAQYILDRLPEIPIAAGISTYSVFATHSIWLKQNSDILSGSVGVNEAGEGPFLASQVELAIGIGTTTPAGYTIKGNRIKVKQNATVNADVYYNELTNNGTITGSLNTPLELPLITLLPEFHTSTPGTEVIVVPQNGEHTLLPGTYGEVQVKKNGKLIFTGGEYHINNFNGGDNNQLLFQGESEVKIADKFETGQGSYIGPEDTTTLSAGEIVFYVEGINGNNGNLGATPKAAKVGLGNTVFANFYVPNGTLWLRQNSEVEGAFIGKDVIVGLRVQVKLNSTF